jgi:transposase-like protein
MRPDDGIDEDTIELIARRVAAALREELEEIAARLAARTDGGTALTVDEVAQRFGVARSTVYAHWQEWGGYKLSGGATAPIRFEGGRLPTPRAPDQPKEPAVPRRPPRRRRRNLIADAPRLDHSIEELG